MTAVHAPRPVTPLGILADTLDRVGRRLDALDVTDPELRSGVARAAALAGGLDPYLTRCTSPESPALAALNDRTRAQDWSGFAVDGGQARLEQEMLSGHVEGQLLKFLVHVTRARHVLDIGMFTGYSALAMAEALPPDGTVVACEVDPFVAGLAQDSFDGTPDGRKIRVEIAPALATLQRLSDDSRTFDVVFLDADKAGYVDYLKAVLDGGLLAPYGVFCVDNTLMQGLPYGAGEPTDNGAAVAEFNEMVVADPRVEQVLVPLRDGVTLIRRVLS